MPVKTKASGPENAEVMIVGEAPGAEEEVAGVPFVGSSGNELTRMLHEAGFVRTECFLTNVCKYRPPMNDIEAFFLDSKCTKPNEMILEGMGELRADIARVKPKLIIALGNTSLWALMGQRGITKWRGSMLGYHDAMLMPTYHPALILREWSWRSIAVHDLRRARNALANGRWPEHDTKFLLRPSFPDAMDCLGDLLRRANSGPLSISSDLETRAGFIACHGIAWSAREAISIPSMCVERPTGYFTAEQDLAIWQRTRELMTHGHVEVIGQNYLYDAQYFARRWGYVPRLQHDTMFMQHVAFAGLPKGLDFLSSMYRTHHRYWKDEGKNWNPKVPEDKLWAYNCEDAIATWEVRYALEKIIRDLGLWDVYRFQMHLWRPVLRMMLRGIRIDQLLKGKIAGDLLQAIDSRQRNLDYIVGYPLNVQSPKQMANLFYEQLGCKLVRNRKTKQPTCDEDALLLFAEREPLFRPVVELCIDLRSLGVMMSNVIQAPLDADGRLRCSFNPAATEVYRFNSSKNAFGGGTNMQNWTKGDEENVPSEIKGYPIPNVRKLVVPDLGFEIASMDLAGADAQTVAWESGDEDLKAAFRAGVKIHAHNAKMMYPGKAITGLEQPYYGLARNGVHAVDNGCGPDMLAIVLGSSREIAVAFIKQWFTLHPKILEWHEHIQDILARTRTISNKFGHRRFYFDRIDGLLPEAIAWYGQSTTACVANVALANMEEDAELQSLQCEPLIQVHDEIVFQYPISLRDRVLKRLFPLVHITVPYDDPLVIPWRLKTSQVSWGQCEACDWPR